VREKLAVTEREEGTKGKKGIEKGHENQNGKMEKKLLGGRKVKERKRT
jgi:hypothetical protein